MIIDKKTLLRPLLESSQGIHISAYLVNRWDIRDLHSQIEETIGEANQWLLPVLNDEERKKFLEPFANLLKNTSLLTQIKSNIGIFRTKDSFRILNVPVTLERQCHVANSFHVKPLLRWMQIDREFILLGVSHRSAQLYFGNLNSIRFIDSIQIEASEQKGQKTLSQDEILSWLPHYLERQSARSPTPLFLAGDSALIKHLTPKIKYRGLIKAPISAVFEPSLVSDLCRTVRSRMKSEMISLLETALLEFRFAEENNLAKKNVFQIAKAAVLGKVKKLIIADGINIFGKFDRKTGGLLIHPFDLDHEDDDILDDLAQTVLASGGDVVIAAREDIPKGHPVLAILENHQDEIETTQRHAELTGLKQREVL